MYRNVALCNITLIHHFWRLSVLLPYFTRSRGVSFRTILFRRSISLRLCLPLFLPGILSSFVCRHTNSVDIEALLTVLSHLREPHRATNMGHKADYSAVDRARQAIKPDYREPPLIGIRRYRGFALGGAIVLAQSPSFVPAFGMAPWRLLMRLETVTQFRTIRPTTLRREASVQIPADPKAAYGRH